MGIKDLRAHTPYILAIIAVSLIYFNQFYNVMLPPRDVSIAYLPMAELLKISALEYNDYWPLWNPFGFAGDPLLMKPLPGLDSLLGFLLMTIPSTVIALKLNYFLLFILSGISMYALMNYFNAGKKFALVSAMVYVLNGYMGKVIVWGWGSTLGGYSILPLAFMFGIKAVEGKEAIKDSIIAGIVFAALFRLNADMKVTMWIGILFGLYLLFRILTMPSRKEFKKTIFASLIITTLLFGLSAQRMIPNMDFIKMTSRSGDGGEFSTSRQLSYGDAFNRLVEPIYRGMPQILRNGTGDHIGIIAFLLAGYAIVKRHRSKRVLFFFLGAVFSVFVATNTFGLYYLLWLTVPFFKSLRYLDRSLFLYAFCLSVLAGIGAKELFKKINDNKKAIIAYSALVILLFANLWLFSYKPYSDTPDQWVSPEEAVSSNQILQFLSQERKNQIFRIQTWETRGIDWGTDAYNVPLRLEHLYKYDGIWYPPYMNVYLSIALNNPAKFWGMLNLKYLTAQTPLNLSGFRFVRKFENCTVCFAAREQLQKAWGPFLYENELFLPRAYFVNNSVAVVGEEESATQAIYWLMLNPNFNPDHTVILRGRKSINDYRAEELSAYSAIVLAKGSIDQNSASTLNAFVGSGGLLLPDVTKNSNSISDEEAGKMLSSFKGGQKPVEDRNVAMLNFDSRKINLDGQKGFLVYSEKFSIFPGWTAKSSDGKRLPLINANAMGTAILLKGDEASISFTYKPRSYAVGSFITGITIALLLIYFIIRYLFPRKENRATPEQ